MAAGRDQDKTYEDKVHDIRIRMHVSELLHEMGKPTIAMVNGVAAGAGLSLALAADMRFAGKSARMTTAFAKVGFSGDFGSHYFLHKLVGTAKARELYFTAEILNAEQIEKLGLANRVIDDANLDGETMAFAKKLAAGPRVAWWHVKKNMKVAEEGTLSEALDSEAARMIRTGETEDHKEAARAVVERGEVKDEPSHRPHDAGGHQHHRRDQQNRIEQARQALAQACHKVGKELQEEAADDGGGRRLRAAAPQAQQQRPR